MLTCSVLFTSIRLHIAARNLQELAPVRETFTAQSDNYSSPSGQDVHGNCGGSVKIVVVFAIVVSSGGSRKW